MPPSGPPAQRASLSIVGEAPGYDEIEEGVPFVGRSGEYTIRGERSLLGDLGVQPHRVHINNAMLCRAPGPDYRTYLMRLNAAYRARVAAAKKRGDKPPPKPVYPHVACQPRLLAELTGARVVVAMGAWAARSIIKLTNIDVARGAPVCAVIEDGAVQPAVWGMGGYDDVVARARGISTVAGISDRPLTWIVPTYHPAHILRGAGNREPALKQDLARAVSIAQEGAPSWDPGELILRPPAAEAIKWLDLARARRAPLAVDVETDGGSVMGAPLTFIAFSDGEATLGLQLRNQDGSAFYGADDNRVRDAVRAVLSDPDVPKGGQNFVPFDVLVIDRNGLGPVRGIAYDTFFEHNLTRSEEPDGLEYLGGFYTDAPAWKGLAGEAKGEGFGIGVPDEVLSVYNALDACVTARVAVGIRNELETLGPAGEVLRRQMMALGHIARRMRVFGLRVDPEDRERNRVRLSAKIDDATTRMFKIVGREFKPGSLRQLRRIIFDGFKCRVIGKTATGMRRLTADDLTQLALEGGGDARKFIQALLDYRESQKLLSTYVENLEVWTDGRVHSAWNVGGAISGRWASDAPNLTNQPEEMRTMYVAAPGHVFILADYDQIEARFNAILSGDKYMLDAFARGVDIHTANASALFSVPVEQVTPKQRSFAKRFLYALSYGAGAVKIWTNLLPDYPDLKLEHIRKLLDDWWGVHPEWATWRQAIYEDACHRGWSASPIYGRRRTFTSGVSPGAPPPTTEVYNFPAQCVLGFSRILTRDGYIPIIELVGRQFDAWTGKEWAPATAIHKGEAEIFEVWTDRGVRFRCDRTHKLLAPDPYRAYRWRRVSDMQYMTRVALDLARPLEFGEGSDTESAYHLGLWLADGSASKHGDTGWVVRFHIGNGKKGDRGGPRAVRRVTKWLRSIGLVARARPQVGCVSVGVEVGGDHWLRAWGADPNWKAHTKRVPERIWRSSLEIRKAFLRGFLDGDGCFPAGNQPVRVHLCQLELLEELWLLFRTVGVDGTLGSMRQVGLNTKSRAATLRLSPQLVYAHLAWGRPAQLRTATSGILPWWECRRLLPTLRATCRSDETLLYRIRSRGKTGASQGISPYVLLRMGATGIYDHLRITAIRPRRVRLPVFTLSVAHDSHAYVADGFISANSGAADTINASTIRVAARVRRERLGGGLVLQVHDSLGYEAPIAQAAQIEAILREEMTRPVRIMSAPTAKEWVFGVKVETRDRLEPLCARCGVAWGIKQKSGARLCRACAPAARVA